MSKKKYDRWKNWQPPKKLWWKLKPISDESTEARREERTKIKEACLKERKEWSLAQNYARKVARRMFHYQDRKQAALDIVDDIVGIGYCLAIRDYKPDKGAKFSTFLYHVLCTKVWSWTRRFKKNMYFADCDITVECYGNVAGRNYGIYRQKGKNDIPGLTYTILNFDRFICCSPGLKSDEGNSRLLVETNHHELIKEKFTFDDMWMRDSIELLRKVRRMSYAEFLTIKRRYLPTMYRKMTDAKLRGALSFLDVRIFKMVVTNNCENGYSKEAIQRILGIKRDFLDSRLKAILERLDIPYESTVQCYENTQDVQNETLSNEKDTPTAT